MHRIGRRDAGHSVWLQADLVAVRLAARAVPMVLSRHLLDKPAIMCELQVGHMVEKRKVQVYLA